MTSRGKQNTDDARRSANTRVSATETRQVRQVIDELLASPNPVPAIKRCLTRGNAPYATSFQRYAGLVLRDAGAESLVQIPSQRAVNLVPPSDGHLIQLLSAQSTTQEDKTAIQNVEGALNRLCSIADAIEDSGDIEDWGRQPRISICFLGVATRPDRPGYRSAHIALPEIGRSARLGVEYFNEIDWRALEHVAVVAHHVFQSSLLPNMHQSFMGGYGPAGSDWDVRTRMASTLENLELPLPFDCRFDCDIPEASAAVRFVLPSRESLPQRVTSSENGQLIDVGDRLDDALMAYALRLACLLAAACFGGSRHIDSALIAAEQCDGSPAFTCRFTRKVYVHRTLMAIDTGELMNPDLRFDPESLVKLMAPDSITFGALQTKFGEGIRIRTDRDERNLPEDARRLFHARRVCDIDTLHPFGTPVDSISEARLDSNESVLAAIARLEETMHEAELCTVPPDDDASSVPLYCANPLERATVSLRDEIYTIGLQAEAYLHGDKDSEVDPDDVPFYFRAPDALFQSLIGLSDLYVKLGDYLGAESLANSCLTLAPTTAQAYYQKANVLAEQNRFAEAANTIMEGLRYVVSERDCALLYYHLALIMGKLGRSRDAASILVYTMSLSGEYADKAASMVRSLRKQDDTPVIIHASAMAAARELAQARIPLAPSDTARALIVYATIALSCANAPLAAAPYASAIAGYFRNDTVITSTARSLQRGIQNSPAVALVKEISSE